MGHNYYGIKRRDIPARFYYKRHKCKILLNMDLNMTYNAIVNHVLAKWPNLDTSAKRRLIEFKVELILEQINTRNIV